MQGHSPTGADKNSPDTRDIYDALLRHSSAAEPPPWLNSPDHAPGLVKTWWDKNRGCLLKGELPVVLKELVVFVASRPGGAGYCSACHAHAALQRDPTPGYRDLVSILDPQSTVPLPVSHRMALQFADQMAQGERAVTLEDFEKLLASGFTESEARELLSVIDLTLLFKGANGTPRPPDAPHKGLV